MDSLKLLNSLTFVLIIVALGLIYPLVLSYQLNTSSVDIITSIMTGLMVIAIGIQIFSSNQQLARLIPKVKIIGSDCDMKYELTQVAHKGDIRMTRREIHLSLLNESDAPLYIQFYEIKIGNWKSYMRHRFPLKVQGSPDIEWHPFLFIPPHEMKVVDIIEDDSDSPGSCSYMKGSIEHSNKNKLEDIHEVKLTLIGNFGTETAKIDFHEKRNY